MEVRKSRRQQGGIGKTSGLSLAASQKDATMSWNVCNGETSRSPFQRGNEHMKEISDGLASHPLTIHFREEHGGRQQEVLLRILSRHISPLDRQVVESLNIIKASKISEECLNLKSEWGGQNCQTSKSSDPKEQEEVPKLPQDKS